MTGVVAELIVKLRQTLSPVFLGSKLGELTDHSISWGTVQNKRSRREIPNESSIFIRSGNRVLVVRDPFLAWWASTLSEARRPPVVPSRPPPRRSRGQIEAEALVAEIAEPAVGDPLDEVQGAQPPPRIGRRRSLKPTAPRAAEAASTQ